MDILVLNSFISLLLCVYVQCLSEKHFLYVDNCDAVNLHFSKLNITLVQPLQSVAFHDSTVKICYDGAKHSNHKSCCSREEELKYNHMAQMRFLYEVKYRNEKLKSLLQHQLNYFQKKFLFLIEVAENKTDIMLRLAHEISIEDRRPIITKFFAMLRKYLLDNTMDISKNINTLFYELFPHVFYQKKQENQLTRQLTERYTDCLIQNASKLDPNPFGLLPIKIISSVTYTFSIAHSFLETIKLAIEALNVTEKLNSDISCINALTRLHFCPICHGHLKVKPCLGFCQNVMRGCLSKMIEIASEWDGLISSLKDLSLQLDVQWSYQKYLMNFDSDLSSAIRHALSYQHVYYKQITRKFCGPAILTNRTAVLSHEETYKNPGQITSLYPEIVKFVDGVVSHHGWPAKLAHLICNNSEVYEQSLENDECWNGERVSLYVKQIPSPHFISQVKYNPEVSVVKVHNPALAELKHSLAHFRQVVNRRLYSHHTMQADQGSSGDGYRDDTYRRNYYSVGDDDTYTDENSGSGSGSGDNNGDDDEDQERDKEKNNKPTAPEYKNIDKKTDIEFEEKPKITRTKESHGSKGVAQALHLHSILPVVCLIVYCFFTPR